MQRNIRRQQQETISQSDRYHTETLQKQLQQQLRPGQQTERLQKQQGAVILASSAADNIPSSFSDDWPFDVEDSSSTGRIWISHIVDEIPIETHVDEGTMVNKFQYNPFVSTRLATRTATSKFLVDIIDAPSAAHETAIRYGMARAQEVWVSSETVRVQVAFTALESPEMLGTGRPSRNWRINNVLMSMALAKAIEGRDLNAKLTGEANYDIIMTLNSKSPWYLLTDGQTTGYMFDLVTVSLHEAYHGLFMSGGNIDINYSTEDGKSEYEASFLNPSVTGRFDSFMTNHEGCNIAGYSRNHTALGSVLTSNNLYFASNEGTQIARLHSPRPFVPGSSIYHLSESEYGSGADNNDLMTPAINAAYSQHNVGAVMRNIQKVMQDLDAQTWAPICEQIGAPLVDDAGVDQTSDNGSSVDSQELLQDIANSWTLNIGGKYISGWAVIGGGGGGLVLLVSILWTVRALSGDGDKRKLNDTKEKRSRPDRRSTEAIDFKGGGNEGGLV
jgi:hypothetical protein